MNRLKAQAGLLALIVLAGACSSGAEPAELAREVVSGDDTDEAADGSDPTSPAATDTTAAAGPDSGGGGAECLVGSWRAIEGSFAEQIDAILAGLPGVEVELAESEMIADFHADGTADFDGNAIMVVIGGGLGEVEGVIDSALDVTWSVEGDTLSYTATGWAFEMMLAGLPFNDVPGPDENRVSSATFTCSDEALELHVDDPAFRIPSRLERVG